MYHLVLLRSSVYCQRVGKGRIVLAISVSRIEML